MTSDLWTYLELTWPQAAAGVTQRGPHDPLTPWSGHNMAHTERANHAAVSALRERAAGELSLGAPASSRQPLPSSLRGPRASSPQVVGARQIHSAQVSIARHDHLPALPHFHDTPRYPDCDALITDEPGLALTLFFADCCPIIIYSPDPLCGGVAHAGWRGTVADIAGAVVSSLYTNFSASPDRLHAIVGPCIGVECYQIGPEVAEAVEGLGMAQTLDQYGASVHLDLLSLNEALLQRAGVPPDHIRTIPHCTRCGPVPLFSYRRDGRTTGQHAAMFMLR